MNIKNVDWEYVLRVALLLFFGMLIVIINRFNVFGIILSIVAFFVGLIWAQMEEKQKVNKK